MNDLELMRLRPAVLFTVDGEGRLLRVNEPGGAEAPRFFLGRTTEGHTWRFRRDLPAEICEELAVLCGEEPVGDPLPRRPMNVERYRECLGRFAPVSRQSAGPAFRFPEGLLPDMAAVRVTETDGALLERDFPEWVGDVPFRQPFLVLPIEGRMVSLCCSVRITLAVHEAGVETHPAFRGRGFAPQVVAAWAGAVRQAGACPVYSTSWENTASQAVAARLGLTRFGMDFALT